MTAITVSIIVLGAITFFSIRRESEHASSELMRLTCDERRQSINDYLVNIEKTQQIVAYFASTDMSISALARGGVMSVDGWGTHPAYQEYPEAQQAELDEYLAAYIERVDDVFRSAVSDSAGIVSFYYRINPEISEDKKGFLYTRISSASFRKTQLTDLGLYDKSDMEHVGWYYIPLRRGTASWLGPYDNKNLGVKMISYETPIYKANTFLGVMGVDVSYDTLVDMIRDIRIYETDYACLLEPDGTIIYHPTSEPGSNLSDGNPELATMVEMMGEMDSNAEPIRYTIDGERRQLFFSTLANGQKLIVTAPVREINASWIKMTYRLGAVLFALLLLFARISALSVRRIVKPLQRLTQAARGISNGDYSVELEEDGGDDEVSMLTQTFQQLVNHLRIYISDLNSMAYRDAMTGVKNKAAYEISASKLNDMIRMDAANAVEFALVMFDCNDLKKINDSYGHEKGDVYLQTACKLICDVFIHCPVFRVGGDEFVALLTEESYSMRDELLKAFDTLSEAANQKAEDPWERICIAKGMAAYDPEADGNVENVLHRADELMYENKKLLKQKAAAGERSDEEEDESIRSDAAYE